MSIHLREIAIRSVPFIAAVALVAGLQRLADAGALGLGLGIALVFGGIASLTLIWKR